MEALIANSGALNEGLYLVGMKIPQKELAGET